MEILHAEIVNIYKPYSQLAITVVDFNSGSTQWSYSYIYEDSIQVLEWVEQEDVLLIHDGKSGPLFTLLEGE